MLTNILRLTYDENEVDTFDIEVQITDGELETPDSIYRKEKGNSIILKNYSGKIFLPKNVALDIVEPFSTINVKGSLNSPANFQFNGSINLYVPKESDLEMICDLPSEKSFLRFNDYSIDERYFSTGERNFDDLRTVLYKELSSRSPQPLVTGKNGIINAEFIEQLPLVEDIDVCIFYNLVLVNNVGTSNIYYPQKRLKSLVSMEEDEEYLETEDLKDQLFDALDSSDFFEAEKQFENIKNLVFYSGIIKGNREEERRCEKIKNYFTPEMFDKIQSPKADSKYVSGSKDSSK